MISKRIKLFLLLSGLMGLNVFAVSAYWEEHRPERLAVCPVFVAQEATNRTESASEEKSKENGDEETNEKNYVTANDDLSNLQLSDATTPVYDRYTLQEREERKLTTALPKLTPFKAAGKIAYLTFDDGPDNKNTPDVLKILREKNVKATFYVVGRMAENNPAVLKDIFAAGHAIGNHSYDHNYRNLYPNKDKFLAQIVKTDGIIHKILGVRPLIIRAPGGTVGMFTKDYPPLLKQKGYAYHDWNIENGDAVMKNATADRLINNVLREMREDVPDNSMLIILMHCGGGKEETVKALPRLIDLLRERGYEFGVVTPMTPPAW